MDKIEDICEVLKQQYQGVFSTPKQEYKISKPDTFFSFNVTNYPSLTTFDITTKDILDAAADLRPNSAAGPDEFPAIVLKRCATQLCIPLQLLWSASLLESVIPDTTRSARITPLYKGRPRSMPKNYRPVALTSHVIKLFEKIVVKNIMNFLEHNTLMNRGQHGFRRGRSCLSQLLEHHTHLLESIEAGLNSDVIYLDFEKAFDKVDHGVLLHKMRNLGITGNIGRWVHAFLSNRTQVVTIDGCVSKQSSVVSGVPQGSVLGPILFLILISDIDQEVKTSKVTSFADDTRVSHSIKDKDDVIALQNDLQSIYRWADNNNMSFNSSKFEVVK
ncbi:hypothetical protein Pcinc_014051 [Petrolisthes cinctipes]|uniref:Reverse transcriptase domain-containing protein n=1 Tax=Petrolisthes cinctipes TaxID=88211 RepID=A0AAE1FXS2_PETCI|nr:hypothetical protein Pcinc_014051 [Petrolisthes cinctipes]